ncbi:alpha/beta hydrolase domain-containing protein [Neglectibacter timonensis]|uniref:Alpha/beta hydrolase domain-containing protein n=1 Tax=Neglectibacter timonensis TaxID=1776382 RepID=A0ABT1S0V8_9FIRM|nr:alpha/beta hydrolase domain-containing protein [Neglectibacter timonensis]MCQ4840577.1 alpha/beta hydrolase domain-containing protein [Neglectibacter timonensis]MCQ4845088.1 alpha/beta hydrolase domain-containing protein [Neglectibacter timonensis]
MITEIRKVPVTEETRPFATALKVCPLEELGYAEEEFFQSGTANVYREEEEVPVVEIPDAPYTTRLLIRRPKDPKKFSGNVVIEILNASAMMDIDRIWVNCWRYFTRHGDIYIGITSKGHVVDALKAYDPQRYAPINWANPNSNRVPCDEVKNSRFGFLPQYEQGLFWDMLLDLAKILRTESPMNPIADCGKAWLYLTGWSQSGAYLSRVVNTFAYLPENCQNGPLFDGYIDAGSGASNAPINAYEPFSTPFRKGRPTASLLCTKEPCIAINTESENRSTFWYGNFDEPNCKFRTWQIPCSSHDNRYNLVDYYHLGYGTESLHRLGRDMDWEGYQGEALNTPYHFIFHAAFDALYHWVRDGIPAPYAPKIITEMTYGPTDPTGVQVANRTDSFGNALGGIRYPAADCPTSVCQSYTLRKDGGIQQMFGTEFPFSSERLNAIYGDIGHYRTLVEKSVDNAVAHGWILADDREALIEASVETAKQRGLSCEI